VFFVTSCILVEESDVAGDYNFLVSNPVELPEYSNELFTQELELTQYPNPEN